MLHIRTALIEIKRLLEPLDSATRLLHQPVEAPMTKAKPRAKVSFTRKFTHPERKIKTDPDQLELQRQLEKELKQTFPASDPPAISQPTTAGAAENRKSNRG